MSASSTIISSATRRCCSSTKKNASAPITAKELSVTQPVGAFSLTRDIYQGVQSTVRAIQPKKQPRHGSLTADDVARNQRVSSDRVIVENFFGRLCMLWKVMYKKFTLAEEKYDGILRLCVALTNFHISLNPLRAEDADYYARTLARYASQAQLDRERRRQGHLDAMTRRRERLTEAPPAQRRRTPLNSSAPTPAGNNNSFPMSPDLLTSHKAIRGTGRAIAL